jgi:Mg-chelatase subunit ChlI
MNDTTKINQHNVVSSNDAITYIESLVNTLISDPSLAKKLPPVMLRGAPGVGKSTIVRSIAEKLGIEDKRVVNGVFTALQKKELGKRVEAEIELADGTHQKVKFLKLTDAGKTFDPNAEADAE